MPTYTIQFAVEVEWPIGPEAPTEALTWLHQIIRAGTDNDNLNITMNPERGIISITRPPDGS